MLPYLCAMTISYKWLADYLPVQVEPDRLGRILTSVGLEVESMETYEEIPGSLKDLVIGEVLETSKHPNADKLTITRVHTGNGEPLQIVCGAPNVAAGQKVVVALPGTTIYPLKGDPLTMRIAKIRGAESHGMICAEDEIGLGQGHEGILVLPANTPVGTPATEYFNPYSDIVYRIGLTPNRMDAMSHWGVARDVCAYLSHHEKKELRPRLPLSNGFKPDDHTLVISVEVAHPEACPRYSGLALTGIGLAPSPAWMQQRLRAIGIRPINNVVDITNYVQQETGQPLHAFDADRLSGKKITVKFLPEGTPFTTLDEKERKLSAEDLVICDEDGGACLAGVFGGLRSGVTADTRNIFLESACFDPVFTRKTSFRHQLRTEAASRFEKGTDISATVPVLKRAAQLFREITGAKISSEIIDIYPDPVGKTDVGIKYHYLKKISGKNYHPDAVKNILGSLGFEITKEGIDELRVAVPYHKPDISLPADLVEEILRIDGLDNIDIPSTITITPASEEFEAEEMLREKISDLLVGFGFYETLTNSITNASYFSEEHAESLVTLINSLSAEHNVMRPSLFETSLEVVARNLNQKNLGLRLFEFGNTYSKNGPGKYRESRQLALVASGRVSATHWSQKPAPPDIFYLKGVMQAILRHSGIGEVSTTAQPAPPFEFHLEFRLKGTLIGSAGKIKNSVLDKFDIRQPVYFGSFDWDALTALHATQQTRIQQLPRFPFVERDLSMVVSRDLPWEKVEGTVQKLRLDRLRHIKLFDIFESEKLGAGKKSMAVNFLFRDDEKTLTDKEIDGWMDKIMSSLEKDLDAEIRKG